MTPDEVRKTVGRARDEQNVADSFQMKYIVQNLKSLIITDDFRSPLKEIIIMEDAITFSGQKKVTQDEAKSLIQGQWLLEEAGFTPQHPQDYLIIFNDNNRRDRSLHTDTAYKITSDKTIEFQVKHSMGMDDTWDEWHFAFLDDGDTLRLYKLDKYEEIDTSNMEIYYRYSK